MRRFSAMNRLMALLFGLATIGAFALSQRDSYRPQPHSAFGQPIGEARTVQVTEENRIFYLVVGAVSMGLCLYFVSRIRLRK